MSEQEKKEKPGIGTSLVDSITMEELGDLAQEYGEIGLDSILDEGLMQDIPVFRTLVALGRITGQIRDRLLAQKIYQFLVGLHELSLADRWEMIGRLEQDEVFEQKVGEQLIELLDRIDSHRKPKMIARVFRAYAKKEIDCLMLQRLNVAIERLPVFEIRHISDFAQTKMVDPSTQRAGDIVKFHNPTDWKKMDLSEAKVISESEARKFFQSRENAMLDLVSDQTKLALVNAGMASMLNAVDGITFKPTQVCFQFLRLGLEKVR